MTGSGPRDKSAVQADDADTASESAPTAPSVPGRTEDGKTVSTGVPLLEVENLVTWFPIRRGVLRRVVGHVRAVDGVSFSVDRGNTLALVGESGCGKTTVGRSILRLVEPQEGHVRFRGQDLLQLSDEELHPLRQKIQMVFQDPMTSLNPRMRVLDLVAEGIDTFGMAGSPSERESRVEQALLRVKLSADHMRRFPHEFSGGQRQRIGIARALAVEPDLLVCDEAVSALDVSIQAQILNLLGQLQEDLGLAYVFITHDLSVVRYLADEVAVMYLGEIVERAPASELFAQPAHPYTQGLVAAVPSADPTSEPVKAQVLGDVPSPAAPPPGCRFHSRCPQAFDKCRTLAPSRHATKGGYARCHLLDATAEEES